MGIYLGSYVLISYVPAVFIHSVGRRSTHFPHVNGGALTTWDGIDRAIRITIVGPETYALARSLAAPKDLAHVNYEEMLTILTGHFCPKPNVIVQRYHFNKHNQGNEPIATYIAELRRLSENCEFVDLDDRLRDRLLCGLKKESLVKRLLSEKDLTFEKAIDIALCDESASANASVLMETTPDVNILRKASRAEPPKFKSGKVNFKEFKKMNNKIICIRCKGNHMPNVCKFRNAKCFKCGKIGHLQKACLTRVKKFEYLNRSNSDTYLHCIGTESLSNPFYIMVKLDNHDVAMLIDSGSAYSLLNKETFLKYWRVTQLEKSEVLLKTWSSSNVKISGKLFVKAKVTNGFKKLSILVADGLGPNILGRQWFEAFRLRIDFFNHIETNPFSSEFEEVFKQEIDAYNGPLIHIDIPENAEPKFVKARTVPFALRELVDEKLKSLEEQGVVEPVKFTKWASPIVTVLKNDGTIRICHDYKSRVNLYSNPDKYPLPTIPQLLDRLRGGRVFTKLDMAQAYQQLKVDETSAEILAINTPRGLYKVKRLPFGLNSAVGTFQRFMDTLLSGIDGVAVYLDDVLISGRDCDDLKIKTEKVLLRFRESGLCLKKEKCHFYVPEIEFLGMIIDHKGINPSEEKLRAIKDARPPSNKRELMSFLGLLNYYERFLNNKATVAEPLHRLLDSNSPWKWNKEHQRSFAEVKNLISSKSVLAHFNEDLPILVNCDASEYGVGAILSQIDHGVERPVVFASRTLNKTERRYAVIDKEALAVIFGVSKFSQYLLGRKFKILTDHKPLVGIFNPKKPIPQVLSPRMLRWCLTLAAYTYSIEYKPGKVNCNADALSRLPLNECPSVVPNPSEVFFIESEHAAINSSEVAKLTNKDPILSKVKFWAMNGWPERKVDDKFRDFVSKSSEISVHKDCLLWGSRVIIPERLRKYILNLLHDTHMGIVGTKALARELCWWPKMDRDIERMISSCAVCLSCSHDPPKTDVYPWIWPSRPWSRLHIDHAGPFQGKLLLVVVDAYSKWIEAKIVSTTSTETTINCLKEIFATHGLPDVIVSDNGTSFTSELFRTFLKRNGVRHILCAPYHAASNGQVERAIQTLKNLLRKNSSGNWTTRLSRSLLSMRIAINSTTQKSPAQLLMNRNLKSLINKFHPEGVSEGRMRQEDRFIRNWKPHRVVNEGQAVIARGYHGPRWLPGVVREKTGPVSIKVETDEGEILNRHLDQVRDCGEREATPSTSATPQESNNIEDPQAGQEIDPTGEASSPILRRSSRLRRPSKILSTKNVMWYPVDLIYGVRSCQLSLYCVDREEQSGWGVFQYLSAPCKTFNSSHRLQAVVVEAEWKAWECPHKKRRHSCTRKMAAGKLIPFLQDDIQSMDFDEYVRYFNNYMIAEDKLNVEENRKIAIFLNSVGAEAQRQYYTLPKASTVTSLSEAIDLLRQRYVVKSRPWVIRMKFNDRRQLQGETIADYISALRALAKDCAYGSMEDELIRDRFIVGTKIKQLRDRLLVETTDLNLDQVVQLATQYEKAQEDNKLFDNTPKGINKIAANDRRTEPILRERKKISTNFKCLRCGGKHKATSLDCPAKDVKCHQCLKDGKVNQITESSKIIETLPFAKDIEYKIFADTSVPPVQQKLRRLPPVLLYEVHKEIQRLVKMDTIEIIVTSKWISPIVVSKKKDGSIRLCVDLREPNKAVILDAYPIPLIEDILSSLHGCKVFTNLDLSQAYHQIRLHPDSSELLMDIKGVSCYLDDIIIGGSSMEDHDKKLNQVLARLREVNLMLNDAKSIHRQKYLKFLGHIIDYNGVHLDEELMKPLLDAPPPKDKSGLRSLIGMINWFQKYIPNKSTIMEPLQKLLKKSVLFKWRGEHAKALQTVKDSLKKGQVLALFCPKLPTVITTDASHSGIGCVVSQLSEKGEERIVACASRTLSDAERKYSIVEKEALACVWACEKFRRWVWGLKFTLKTDQSSLTTLLTTKGNYRAGLRIARWSARLMNFDYNIEYKKGRDNVLPDYLSRSSLSSYEDYDGEVELIASINQDMLAISEEEFLRECSLCPEIIALKEQLMKPWSNNESSQLNKNFRFRKDLSVQEDLILNEKGKILVPVSLRNKLLSFAHKAHQGMVRTKQRLRESYWWPGMDKDVEDLITNCWVCKNHDKRLKSIRVPITPVERPANPWTKLGLDIVGPFIDSEIGFRFAITLIDYTSKWPEVFCTNKTTSKVIINFLEDVFSREGFPREIVTDNGTPFISEEFEDFLRSNGIKHILTANYHPACNGEVENFNKTLKSTVLTAHLQHTEVKRTIQLFLREYRSTPHTVTKKTPSAVLHGRTLRTLVHVFDKEVETKPPKEACRQEDKSDSESKAVVLNYKLEI
ncbi:K02A2.6-like, partial [Cordylochernes scorpioides]